MITQAIIFSAGMGTRLKPLTDTLPKALVEVNGKPMLQWNIEKLKAAGCHTIVVNVHHFPEMIRNFLSIHHNFGINIHISDESSAILDTGGGLVHAAHFFDRNAPIVAHNVDVLSDLDLSKIMQYHTQCNRLVTLVVRNRETQRYLLFDNQMRLCGWQNIATGEVVLKTEKSLTQLTRLAFSGIHIIEPSIFSFATQKDKFSIIDLYLQLATTQTIIGFNDTSSQWIDIGKPEQLKEAQKIF